MNQKQKNIIIFLSILVATSFVILFFFFEDLILFLDFENYIKEYLKFAEIINQNIIFYSIIYILCSSVWISLVGIASPMLIVSTLMFGYLGAFLSIISFLSGSTLTFLFANKFKNSLSISLNKITIKKNNVFLFIIFRFIPGIPFIVKNTSGVLFNLKIRFFILATAIAEIPQIILFTFILKRLVESSEILAKDFDISIVYDKLFLPVISLLVFVIFLFFIKIKFKKLFSNN